MEIIKFIGVLCFTWLFTTGAAPVQFIKEFLKVQCGTPAKDIPRQLLSKLINCDLCAGFWIGLIVYQNIWIACIVSLCAEGLGRILSYLKFS